MTETPLRDSDMISDMTEDEGEQDMMVSRKRKNLDNSRREHKRPKMCSTPATSSTESLNEDTLTVEGMIS